MTDIKLKLFRPAMEVETEFGSLDELIGWLNDQKAPLLKLFGDGVEAVLEAVGDTAISTGVVTTTETADKPTRRKRNQPDPSTATAPEPIAPPAIDTTPNAGGIPAFLDRNAAAAPPPPPLMPAAPPVAPVAPTPPTGVLAVKLIEWLDGKKAGAADEGKALAEWLTACGVVKAGATYDEGISTLRMMSDDKLKAIAAAVGIAA